MRSQHFLNEQHSQDLETRRSNESSDTPKKLLASQSAIMVTPATEETMNRHRLEKSFGSIEGKPYEWNRLGKDIDYLKYEVQLATERKLPEFDYNLPLIGNPFDKRVRPSSGDNSRISGMRSTVNSRTILKKPTYVSKGTQRSEQSRPGLMKVKTHSVTKSTPKGSEFSKTARSGFGREEAKFHTVRKPLEGKNSISKGGHETERSNRQPLNIKKSTVKKSTIKDDKVNKGKPNALKPSSTIIKKNQKKPSIHEMRTIKTTGGKGKPIEFGKQNETPKSHQEKNSDRKANSARGRKPELRKPGTVAGTKLPTKPTALGKVEVSNKPGMLSKPGTIGKSGSIGKPGVIARQDDDEVMERSGGSRKPWGVKPQGKPEEIGKSGAFNEPGTLNKPGALNKSSTLGKPDYEEMIERSGAARKPIKLNASGKPEQQSKREEFNKPGAIDKQDALGRQGDEEVTERLGGRRPWGVKPKGTQDTLGKPEVIGKSGDLEVVERSEARRPIAQGEVGRSEVLGKPELVGKSGAAEVTERLGGRKPWGAQGKPEASAKPGELDKAGVGGKVEIGERSGISRGSRKSEGSEQSERSEILEEAEIIERAEQEREPTAAGRAGGLGTVGELKTAGGLEASGRQDPIGLYEAKGRPEGRVETQERLGTIGQEPYGTQDKPTTFGRSGTAGNIDIYGRPTGTYEKPVDAYGRPTNTYGVSPKVFGGHVDAYGKPADVYRGIGTQERSGAQERPGTQERPSVQERLGAQGRPDVQERLGAQERPGTYERSGAYDRTEAYERPREHERPGEYERSDRPKEHERSERPGEYERPGTYGGADAYRRLEEPSGTFERSGRARNPRLQEKSESASGIQEEFDRRGEPSAYDNAAAREFGRGRTKPENSLYNKQDYRDPAYSRYSEPRDNVQRPQSYNEGKYYPELGSPEQAKRDLRIEELDRDYAPRTDNTLNKGLSNYGQRFPQEQTYGNTKGSTRDYNVIPSGYKDEYRTAPIEFYEGEPKRVGSAVEFGRRDRPYSTEVGIGGENIGYNKGANDLFRRTPRGNEYGYERAPEAYDKNYPTTKDLHISGNYERPFERNMDQRYGASGYEMGSPREYEKKFREQPLGSEYMATSPETYNREYSTIQPRSSFERSQPEPYDTKRFDSSRYQPQASMDYGRRDLGGDPRIKYDERAPSVGEYGKRPTLKDIYQNEPLDLEEGAKPYEDPFRDPGTNNYSERRPLEGKYPRYDKLPERGYPRYEEYDKEPIGKPQETRDPSVHYDDFIPSEYARKQPRKRTGLTDNLEEIGEGIEPEDEYARNKPYADYNKGVPDVIDELDEADELAKDYERAKPKREYERSKSLERRDTEVVSDEDQIVNERERRFARSPRRFNLKHSIERLSSPHHRVTEEWLRKMPEFIELERQVGIKEALKLAEQYDKHCWKCFGKHLLLEPYNFKSKAETVTH